MSIELLPQQREALAWTLEGEGRQLAWVGAIRSGKTQGAALAMLLHMERYSGQACILAGVTVSAVERNVLPYLEQYAQALGIGYRHWLTKSYCDLGKNRFFIFGGSDSDSQNLVQGMTAAGLLVDESTLLNESFVQQALGRLSLPGARAIFTMNPTSPRAWAKVNLVDRIEAGEIRGKVINSRLDDNHYIDQQVRQELAADFHGVYRERFIEGKWASPQGLVYPGWPAADGAPPPLRFYDLAVDFGLSNPTAALLLGCDAQGRFHTAAEYYFDGKRDGTRSAAEHADAIVGLVGGRPLSRCIIDPSALSLNLELRKRGVPVRKGNSAQQAGIQAVLSAFAAGFLTVYPARAPMLAAELDELAWDERAAERGNDKPHFGPDHAADAIRYHMMNRRPPRLTLAPFPKPIGL